MTDAVQRAAPAKTFSFSRFFRNHGERWMNVLSPFGLLLIWEIAARAGYIDTRFFPAPSKIFETMWQLILSGELYVHLKASMYRLFWGFLWGGIGLVLAIPLTASIKAICDHMPGLAGYGRLMGD